MPHHLETPTLFIMIGLPGSGKSSFVQRILPHCRHISLDRLHKRPREERTFLQALSEQVDIVIDNTIQLAMTGNVIYRKPLKLAIESLVTSCVQRSASASLAMLSVKAKPEYLT